MSAFIPLTRGLVAEVDDPDFAWLSRVKWMAQVFENSCYAVRFVGNRHTRKPCYTHRVILGAPAHLQVDHIDGDGLNNQRNNIRLCTKSQNMAHCGLRRNNTLGAKGVVLTLDGRARKHRARITCGLDVFHLGSFHTLREAAAAYNRKATELFGPFALLNDLEVLPC